MCQWQIVFLCPTYKKGLNCTVEFGHVIERCHITDIQTTPQPHGKAHSGPLTKPTTSSKCFERFKVDTAESTSYENMSERFNFKMLYICLGRGENVPLYF